MRQNIVYMFFILMIFTVGIFLSLNLLFLERLTQEYNVRFFIDLTFVAVSCFYLPSILFLESELRPKQCTFFILLTLTYSLFSAYIYTINFDSATVLSLCLIFNVILLVIFSGIHIWRKHPIIIELEALDQEAEERYAAIYAQLKAGIPLGLEQGFAPEDGAPALKGVPTTVDRIEEK